MLLRHDFDLADTSHNSCQVESPLLLEVVVCFHGLNGSRMLFQDSGEQCHAIYN